MSHRAVIVIVSHKRILLMYRRKTGLDYYVVPGGQVEQGESVEDACIREAKEETGLDVQLGEKLWEFQNQGRTDHFYLVKSFTGTPSLGGPELRRCSPDNYYELQWIDKSKLPKANLKPNEIRAKLLVLLDSNR